MEWLWSLSIWSFSGISWGKVNQGLVVKWQCSFWKMCTKGIMVCSYNWHIQITLILFIRQNKTMHAFISNRLCNMFHHTFAYYRNCEKRIVHAFSAWPASELELVKALLYWLGTQTRTSRHLSAFESHWGLMIYVVACETQPVQSAEKMVSNKLQRMFIIREVSYLTVNQPALLNYYCITKSG